MINMRNGFAVTLILKEVIMSYFKTIAIIALLAITAACSTNPHGFKSNLRLSALGNILSISDKDYPTLSMDDYTVETTDDGKIFIAGN
jgi:hypothetical protein